MAKDCQFRLTHYSEITPYALCFAIFGLHLLRQKNDLLSNADRFEEKLKSNLEVFKKQRESARDLEYDKFFLQLLTFTLSALNILGRLIKDPLEELTVPLIPRDIEADLRKIGALNGAGQSGNMAMFKAILLIHARDYLKIDTQSQIDTWVNLHLMSMNRFGFWGKNLCMTHSQFQNGYHQYEIFNYLDVHNPKKKVAAEHIFTLADNEGHFAPYPGGSGCYDYDAISILVGHNHELESNRYQLLMRTADTILKEQNKDGGFAESHKIRPRSFRNILAALRHIKASRGQVRMERLRQMISLSRSKHNRIHTHWSEYSPRWNESDLWNSWFRMLSIARIQIAFDPSSIDNWGFIKYPGIGFHPLLLKKKVWRDQNEYVL